MNESGSVQVGEEVAVDTNVAAVMATVALPSNVFEALLRNARRVGGGMNKSHNIWTKGFAR